MSDSLRPHGLYSPWNSPGQNTGVGSRSLLEGIFPTQGLNPGRLHCRWMLYQLSYQGIPYVSVCIHTHTHTHLTGKYILCSINSKKYTHCVYIYIYIIYILYYIYIFKVLMRWMKLEPIIQSEVSQKEKYQNSILTHIYGI